MAGLYKFKICLILFRIGVLIFEASDALRDGRIELAGADKDEVTMKNKRFEK